MRAEPKHWGIEWAISWGDMRQSRRRRLTNNFQSSEEMESCGAEEPWDSTEQATPMIEQRTEINQRENYTEQQQQKKKNYVGI